MTGLEAGGFVSEMTGPEASFGRIEEVDIEAAYNADFLNIQACSRRYASSRNTPSVSCASENMELLEGMQVV